MFNDRLDAAFSKLNHPGIRADSVLLLTELDNQHPERGSQKPLISFEDLDKNDSLSEVIDEERNDVQVVFYNLSDVPVDSAAENLSNALCSGLIPESDNTPLVPRRPLLKRQASFTSIAKIPHTLDRSTNYVEEKINAERSF